LSERILAIGDIHGALSALETLLEFVALQPTDRLITLGDYVDRGPGSAGVLNRLIELHRTHRITSLTGNHEVMMCQAIHLADESTWWAKQVGRETLESYGCATLAGVPPAHWHFLEHICVPYHESARHVFVHAGLEPDVPLECQEDQWLFWENLTERAVDPGLGKTMICGHTQQKSGVPLDLEFAIGIDTGAYRDDGWLTCLDVEHRKYWQANQRGEKRIGYL